MDKLLLFGAAGLVVYLLVTTPKKNAVTTTTSTPPAGGAPATNTAAPAPSLNYNLFLQLNSQGPEVKALQAIVGATQDSDFGPATQNSLEAYTQNKIGVTYDGVTLGDLQLVAAGQQPTSASDAGITYSFSVNNYSATPPTDAGGADIISGICAV